ncbi:MAG: hypothetical protein AB1696_24040 [Planctomycetota bacterium]
MPESEDNRQHKEGRTVFLVILIAHLALAAVMNGGAGGLFSGEAVSRTGVALDLLAGDMKGRQGLVGSLYWAPLPTLLVLPFIMLTSSGFACCIVSAIVAAAAGTFLNAWWRRHGVSPLARFGGVLLYEIQPEVIMSVITGTSSIVFAALVFVSFACLLDWLRTSKLSSLAYLSVLLALAILTRYQSVVYGAAVFFILLISLVGERRDRGYREAVLFTFLVPLLYATGVWFAANWLIMGDPIFFLRGVLPTCYARTDPYTILTEGCEWRMVLIPMLLVAAARPQARGIGSTLTGTAIVLICLIGVIFGVESVLRMERTSDRREMAKVIEYCLQNHADDRVIIAGYRGYEITRGLDADKRKVFVHYISMYLDMALEQTRGKDLYILIPKPMGKNRWEDVNLKYPGMYEGAPEIILFDHGEPDWETWRLFRIVRTDL